MSQEPLFSLTVTNGELPLPLLQLACLDDHTEEVYPENQSPACQIP